MVRGGATPSMWNFEWNWPRWSEIADFRSIFVRSSSTVRLSEKSSISTNKKSDTRFPMSLRWSSYVAPKSPKGGLKNAKTADFRLKSHFAWRKSATTFLVWKLQRQSYKAFIDLTNRAKMIGGGRPLLPVSLDQTDRVGAKSPIFDLFSLAATQP